jgi:hypothetical protein
MVSWFRQRNGNDSFVPRADVPAVNIPGGDVSAADDAETGELPILDARGIPVDEAFHRGDIAKFAQQQFAQQSGQTDAGLERVLAEREKLIQLCLYALDRARSNGIAQKLEHGLAEIGVVALRPDGARFDPATHEAGGTLPTEDEGLIGTIAETEIPGFVDRDRLLRAPIVTVYTKR